MEVVVAVVLNFSHNTIEKNMADPSNSKEKHNKNIPAKHVDIYNSVHLSLANMYKQLTHAVGSAQPTGTSQRQD